MIRRKYLPMGTGSAGVVFPLLIVVIVPFNGYAYNLLFKSEMNCSQYCKCSENALDSTMRLHNHKHFVFMGERYRPELSYYDTNSEYMLFLGMFAPILHRIAEISCELADGLAHSITSLLNGLDDEMYTSLEVRCRKGEDLIWDMPSWHTSFNVFVSEHCNLVPLDIKRGLIIPMNLWIFDVEKGGHNLLETMNLKFIMNTISLAVKGSRSPNIPNQWKEKYLLSASLISLKDNYMEDFDCSFQIIKRLDTLNLEGNKLSRFPECVLNPKHIRLNYLSLAQNQISDLTAVYEVPENAEMPDIRIINLSANKIRSIEAIRDMGNLVTLDLSHNVIREITNDAFANLKNLEHLYLSHNKIHIMSSYALSKNYRLSVLDLSHNMLAVIHAEQLPAGSVPMELDISDNSLTAPPFRDCAKNKLHNLHIKVYASSNPFYCDCHMIDFEKCQKWIFESLSNYSRTDTIFVDMDNMKCEAPPATKDFRIAELFYQQSCIITENCPAGCACTLLNVADLVINCSSRRLLEMPDTIPSYPRTNVILYMDHNPLQMLSHRTYLRELNELHMDNCLLTSVTPAAISALQNIRVMTLHNNLLQKLPSSTRNITLNHAKNVTLHNNRWVCSCESLWLPRWITKHKSILWMPGSILCNYLRKPVEELSELDLNCNSSSYVDTFLGISLALSSIVSTLVIVFCYRSEINVLLYSKLGLRLGHSFSYGDFFSPYDAFVSYSQDNYRWVVDTLVPHLEKGPHKYRLCLHYRDFPSGESVVDNIPWAIRLSRCSILILSKDFLKKEWSIMEVRAAFQRLLLVANRLIIIATDDINVDELSPDLRAYMNTHDYLRVGESCFWDKLEMFLPPRPMTMEQAKDTYMSGNGSGDRTRASPTPDKFEDIPASEITDVSVRQADNIDNV